MTTSTRFTTTGRNALATRSVLAMLAFGAVPAVALELGAAPAQASLITNGSFEVPDVGSTGLASISPGSEPPGFGWTVDAGNVEVFGELHPALPGPSFDGNQHLDLNGVQVGALSQTFCTTAGMVHQASFMYASNYTHHDMANPALATVRVADVGSGADLVSPLSISHGTSSSADLDWTLAELTFTAAGPLTSLGFQSDSVQTPFGGILLDGIEVTVVPLCSADFDGSCDAPDGVVDVRDLLALLASWGACSGDCPADLDGSGSVDVVDLLELLGLWGPC